MSSIARDLYNKGKAALKNDRYQSAATFFSLAYAEDNDEHAKAEVKHLLGIAYGCDGAFHAAEAAFREALSLASATYKPKIQKDYDTLHTAISDNLLDGAKFREGLETL